MAELMPKERLLPSLLDRLTDNEPRKRDESRDLRAVSTLQLRKSVLRDLEWLMNTINLESVLNLESYPELVDSVINYGLPGLSGSTINKEDVRQIEKLLKRAIVAFEPRIFKDTLTVKLLEDPEKASQHAIAFQIEGTLWGNPFPENLFLRTELDLELGNVTVTEG